MLAISLIMCVISKGQDTQVTSSERACVQGIKCYPLSLLLPGALSLGYERKLTDRFSAEIGSSWYWKDFWSRDFLETYTNLPASGADVSLSLRYKLGKKKVWPGGWSTRAQLMYKRLNNHDFVNEDEGNIRNR